MDTLYAIKIVACIIAFALLLTVPTLYFLEIDDEVWHDKRKQLCGLFIKVAICCLIAAGGAEILLRHANPATLGFTGS